MSTINLHFFKHLIGYLGVSGALRWAESIPKKTITPQNSKTVRIIAKVAKKALKKFIRGEEDELLENHLDPVLFAIKELGKKKLINCFILFFDFVGKKDNKAKSLISALKGNCPRLEVLQVMISLADRVEPDLILPWIKQLLNSSSHHYDKLASVLKSLAEDDRYLKMFVDLRLTKEWKKFVKDTLR